MILSQSAEYEYKKFIIYTYIYNFFLLDISTASTITSSVARGRELCIFWLPLFQPFRAVVDVPGSKSVRGQGGWTT